MSDEKQLDLCQLGYLNAERNVRFPFLILAIQRHSPCFTFSQSKYTGFPSRVTIKQNGHKLTLWALLACIA